MRAIGSPPSGLSLKMAKPAKVTRNRPSSTASAWIAVNGSRNRRFRRAVFCPSGGLRSSAVSSRDIPESTARRYHGEAKPWQLRRRTAMQKPVLAEVRGPSGPPSKKGGSKAALFRKLLLGLDQFATLLAGLSIAALSPVAGAVALTLTPWSRSSAIFKALSSF